MNNQLLVVGSLNMDLVVRTQRHPQPGETVLGRDFQKFPGGKGANQAVAAARLGVPVTMIGCVGDDAFGDELVQSLADDGVDITHIRRDADAATGIALITLNRRGQNTIVVASGANACLSAEHLSAVEGVFRAAPYVLLQMESPLPIVERAVQLAHKYDRRVILNSAPAQPLGSSLLTLIDYLILNETELAVLTGVQKVASVPIAVQKVQASGARRVIVTVGEAGAQIFDDGDIAHLPSFLVEVTDTTAAGDAFVGAFAVALLEGKSTREAVRWGNAAGAIAVSRAGAQPSLPTRSEVEQMLEGGTLRS